MIGCAGETVEDAGKSRNFVWADFGAHIHQYDCIGFGVGSNE